MEDGEILVYADSGCHFNKKGIPRLVSVYFASLLQGDGDVLGFQTILKEYKYTTSERFLSIFLFVFFDFFV